MKWESITTIGYMREYVRQKTPKLDVQVQILLHLKIKVPRWPCLLPSREGKPTPRTPFTPASSKASRQAASLMVSSSSHPPWSWKKVLLCLMFDQSRALMYWTNKERRYIPLETQDRPDLEKKSWEQAIFALYCHHSFQTYKEYTYFLHHIES